MEPNSTFEALLSLRSDLALALRAAAAQGLSEGVCNHFSVAVPGRADWFLLNPRGVDQIDNVSSLDFLFAPLSIVTMPILGPQARSRYSASSFTSSFSSSSSFSSPSVSGRYCENLVFPRPHPCEIPGDSRNLEFPHHHPCSRHLAMLLQPSASLLLRCRLGFLPLLLHLRLWLCLLLLLVPVFGRMRQRFRVWCSGIRV